MQGLLGRKPPKPEDPPVMPDPEAPDVLAARKREMEDGMKAGRAASVLTTARGTLAGGYGGGKLGNG